MGCTLGEALQTLMSPDAWVMRRTNGRPMGKTVGRLMHFVNGAGPAAALFRAPLSFSLFLTVYSCSPRAHAVHGGRQLAHGNMVPFSLGGEDTPSCLGDMLWSLRSLFQMLCACWGLIRTPLFVEVRSPCERGACACNTTPFACACVMSMSKEGVCWLQCGAQTWLLRMPALLSGFA